MTSVTENICSTSSQQWSFSAPPVASPLASGNYLISYGGKCLIVDGSNNLVMSTSGCSTAIWYYTTSTNLQGQIFYYINFVPNGMNTAKDNFQFIIPNAIDCSQYQLVYSNDDSVVTNLPVQLNQDNTIYHNVCGTYYIPNPQGTQILGTDPNDPTKNQWVFTAVPNPASSPLPSGLYSISGKDAHGNMNYLSYTLADKTFNDIMITSPTFSLATCAWLYDATAHTLSTGCGTNAYYLHFDPDNPSWAELTSDATQAVKSVNLTSTSVLIGTYQALIADSASTYIRLYSSVSSAATSWTVTPLSSPAPTGGPASGEYIIKYGSNCLSVNGSSVVLQACTSPATIWTYDSSTKTLKFQNQCLLNPSTTCSSFQTLQLGDCSNANAQRFVLGPNSIYDPQLGFCYTVPPTSKKSTLGLFRTTHKTNDLLTISAVIIAVILIVVASIWWLRRKKPNFETPFV